MPQYPIYKSKINKDLLCLKNGKAGGPDGITDDCIKKRFSLVDNIFFQLFTLIFNGGSFPNI